MLTLTAEDCVEIAAALEHRIQCITGNEGVGHRLSMGKLLDKIGPDGENMLPVKLIEHRQPEITIIVEGGTVQDVVWNDQACGLVDVNVRDYDIQDAEAEAEMLLTTPDSEPTIFKDDKGDYYELSKWGTGE